MVSTRSSKLIAGFSLIIIGIVAGVILTANFNFTHKGKASAESEQRAKLEETMATMKDFSEGFSAVAEYVTPSVVTVETEKTVRVDSRQFNPFGDFFGDNDPFQQFFGAPRGGQPQEQKLSGLGSGVIVSEDGYVITNNHVIDNTDKIKVTLSNEKTYEAKLIGTDPRTDIAILKIDEKGLPAVKIADSDKIKVGQWAVAIGNPFSKQLSHTVTAGIVSGIARSSINSDTDVDFLQTDAAINPGNSGGALVNMTGELIGINAAILSKSGGYEGIGFAIPSNLAKSVMDQLIKNGKVVRGYVGVQMQDISEEMAKALSLKEPKGAVVAAIMEDSPAEKAGLQQGDVITKVNGKSVENSAEIRKNIVNKNPGTSVDLGVIRDGKDMTIKVVLGEAPSEQPVAASKEESSTAKKNAERLGMGIANLSRDLAQKYGFNAKEGGVVITSIDQNGPAFRGGLREGDVIKRVGRTDIKSTKEFSDAVNKISKGDTALFLVNRKGTSMFIAFNIPN